MSKTSDAIIEAAPRAADSSAAYGVIRRAVRNRIVAEALHSREIFGMEAEGTVALYLRQRSISESQKCAVGGIGDTRMSQCG